MQGEVTFDENGLRADSSVEVYQYRLNNGSIEQTAIVSIIAVNQTSAQLFYERNQSDQTVYPSECSHYMTAPVLFPKSVAIDAICTLRHQSCVKAI